MRESYLLRKYKTYLGKEKMSTRTVDNYLTDAISFLNWLSSYLPSQGFNVQAKQPSTYISYINRAAAKSYFHHLAASKLSSSTIQRRAAGLRKFLDFAVSEGYLIKNPADKISVPEFVNPEQILYSFRKWLRDQKVTDTTVKNYVSDIRHFVKVIRKSDNQG